jgi:hypothetical protein
MAIASTRWEILALVLAGCSHAGSSGTSDAGMPGPALAGLQSITVTPANQTLVIAGVTPVSLDYQAIGRFTDGHSEDISDRVSFVLGDATLGWFTHSRFTSTLSHGGATTVQALSGTLSSSTSLTLVMQQRLNDPGSSGLPSDPSTRFSGPLQASRNPTLVYPNDGVLLPPNLGQLEVHFRPGDGNSLFEIAFTNQTTDVRVYARCHAAAGVQLASGCIYSVDSATWQWIAQTNRGGKVGLAVRGSDDSGSGVGVSSQLELAFAQDDIQGGLYYWTTSGKPSIMRFDFAGNQTQAQAFVNGSLVGVDCIGCHALSRDGSKLVAEVEGMYDGRLLLVDVAKAMTLTPFPTAQKSFFESWSPDGSAYVGVDGAGGGTSYNLLLIDGASGVKLGEIAGTGTAQSPSDHPDWSLDGTRIAFVNIERGGTLQRFFGGAISMVTQSGGVWSAPVELVARDSQHNHYYPAFAPDGSFLAFDQSTCPGGQPTNDCDADSDPSATLYGIVPTAGASPTLLARANAPGVADQGRSELANSFPKWAPFVFKRTGELASRLLWITFSSNRAPGLRPVPPSPNGGGELATGTLLWMAAVDPDVVRNGVDGSYPAFFLPFQDLGTSNHIAQWTTKVVPPIQ